MCFRLNVFKYLCWQSFHTANSCVNDGEQEESKPNAAVRTAQPDRRPGYSVYEEMYQDVHHCAFDQVYDFADKDAALPEHGGVGIKKRMNPTLTLVDEHNEKNGGDKAVNRPVGLHDLRGDSKSGQLSKDNKVKKHCSRRNLQRYLIDEPACEEDTESCSDVAGNFNERLVAHGFSHLLGPSLEAVNHVTENDAELFIAHVTKQHAFLLVNAKSQDWLTSRFRSVMAQLSLTHAEVINARVYVEDACKCLPCAADVIVSTILLSLISIRDDGYDPQAHYVPSPRRSSMRAKTDTAEILSRAFAMSVERAQTAKLQLLVKRNWRIFEHVACTVAN